MAKYKNGKIYKLWSPQGDDIYIGSTVNSLSKRKGEHKSGYFNKTSHCNSKILFEKYDDVRIELIEKFACENRMELNAREGYYIRTLECVNKQIAGRTKKEYHENNKEKINEYYKEYREANKEYFKEYNKEYRENNKEYFKEYNKEYREDNREYHKEYYEINKEKFKEYNEKNKEYFKEQKQEWYKKNKEKINQKHREYRELRAMKKILESPVLSPEHSVE
jgi:hypothetical protein